MPTSGTASAAAGVLSLLLLTAVMVLGVLVSLRRGLPARPGPAIRSLHQNLSLLAAGLVAVHVLTAVAVPFGGPGLAAAVVPFVTARARLWLGLGAVSSDLLAALVLTSLLRRRLGRRAWRAVHWLAYACWPAAVAHSVGTGPGVRSGRLLDLAVGCVLAVLAAAAWRLAGSLRVRLRARAGGQ